VLIYATHEKRVALVSSIMWCFKFCVNELARYVSFTIGTLS